MWKQIAVMLLFAAAGEAQSFEVASIKRSLPDTRRNNFEGGPGTKDPGNYRLASATLLDLIARAYDLRSYQQVSGKVPLDQARFDLQARVPAGATKDDFRAMMKSLLAERFHLKAHTETREFPGFELIVAKNGPKLSNQPRSIDGLPSLPAGRPALRVTLSGRGSVLIRLRARQQTMERLARALSSYVNEASSVSDAADSFVVNRTGLNGPYDFTLEFGHEGPRSTEPSSAPSLFDALREQLGLQLVAKKLQFPVVVIDSVDKVPTEN